MLKWIPEFYNQLQDTLKVWLLASPPFAYSQKPEIKMLTHKQNLSSPIQHKNTKINFNFSADGERQFNSSLQD